MKFFSIVALLCSGGLFMIEANADDNPKPDASATLPARFDYQLPDSIVMPGGEVYNHPKIVEVRPNGISIMHDCGVAFWPFSQLPDDIRKKFHYDPVAARKYTDELLLRRKRIDEMKIKKQMEDADQQVYIELVSEQYHCTSLRMKIDAVKRRIKWDKEDENSLSKEVQSDRQIIAKEAAVPSGGNSGGVWGEWSGSSSTDESNRMHVIGEFDRDWKDGKLDYEMWRSAEHAQEEDLPVYQQEYQESLARIKTLQASWNAIQQRRKMDQGKLNKQIHDTVNKTVNDSMAELEKLRTFRNQQLITEDEYIRKKAEILQRF